MTEDVLAVLHQSIQQLLVTKGKLPLLKALAIELKRIGNGVDPPLRNDCVLKIVRDSFDMMVIDLASLREGLSSRRGALNLLRQNLPRLKGFTPEDCDPGPVGFMGTEPDVDEKKRFSQLLSVRMSEQWNAVLASLFPHGAPVTDEAVTDLIKRFRADTEPTERDRNRARAHRYEEAARGASGSFQPLTEVESQLAIFERYLHDLYFILTPGTSYLMQPVTMADSEKTADDLADLITLGSIDQATIKYGVVAKASHFDAEPLWYWFRRQRFFEANRAASE